MLKTYTTLVLLMLLSSSAYAADLPIDYKPTPIQAEPKVKPIPVFQGFPDDASYDGDRSEPDAPKPPVVTPEPPKVEPPVKPPVIEPEPPKEPPKPPHPPKPEPPKEQEPPHDPKPPVHCFTNC